MTFAEERPVFVLSAGWRSGSTLLQRALCSHPEIMIWGENMALVDELRALHEKACSLQDLSETQKKRADGKIHQAWIPMLNPALENFEDGLRGLLASAYRDPARTHGKARWGFKEVRHDLETARFLHRLFPRARFLLLVRNPVDCLASARATTKEGRGLLVQAGGSEAFVNHWTTLTESFLDAEDLGSILIRYEDLCSEPEVWLERIAGLLEIDVQGFDRSVFEKKLRGWKREPFLAEEDRAALASPKLWATAMRLDYEPPETIEIAPSGGRFGWKTGDGQATASADEFSSLTGSASDGGPSEASNSGEITSDATGAGSGSTSSSNRIDASRRSALSRLTGAIRKVVNPR